MAHPFKKLFCVAALAGAALAQNFSISLPAPGTVIQYGTDVTVQIQETLSPEITQIGVAIGAVPSIQGATYSPDQNGLGTVLYSGPFNPQSVDAEGWPYQDFTVQLPATFSGYAVLTAAHFFLLGVDAIPHVEYATTPVRVDGIQG